MTVFGIERFRSAALLVLVSLLCACGSGSGGGKVNSASAAPPSVSVGPPQVRQPMRYRPRNPQVQSLPGLDGVLGLTADGLTQLFGPPRLDVWEGDARKLQFSGNACVLDVYLYPENPGKTPEAAWIDARRADNGQDLDRAGCVEALRIKR